MDEQSKSALPTLTDDDIVEVERPNRRSALAAIGASVAAVFGATVLAPSEAEACRRRTGRTDSDPSDGVGRGHTGINDADSGDEAGCGRGSRYVAPRVRTRRSGCTDSDRGPGQDGVGQGRFCR